MNLCFVVLDCAGRFQGRFSTYESAARWIRWEGLDGATIRKEVWK